MKTLYKIALAFLFLLLVIPVFPQIGQTSPNETIRVTPDSQNREGGDETIRQDSETRPNTQTTDRIGQVEESELDNSSQQIRDSIVQMEPAATPAIDIRHTVQLVPQQTNVSCWAASAAMVVGWRDQISIDPEEIANGGVWRRYYYNGGLPPDNVEMLHYWGLEILPNQTWTVEGFAQILEASPLWVATDLTLNDDGVPNGHIVVVSAMRGDGTPDGTLVTIYDPWEQGMRTFRPSNRGSIYTETYSEFVTRQERLINVEIDRYPDALYIAH